MQIYSSHTILDPEKQALEHPSQPDERFSIIDFIKTLNVLKLHSQRATTSPGQTPRSTSQTRPATPLSIDSDLESPPPYRPRENVANVAVAIADNRPSIAYHPTEQHHSSSESLNASLSLSLHESVNGSVSGSLDSSLMRSVFGKLPDPPTHELTNLEIASGSQETLRPPSTERSVMLHDAEYLFKPTITERKMSERQQQPAVINKKASRVSLNKKKNTSPPIAQSVRPRSAAHNSSDAESEPTTSGYASDASIDFCDQPPTRVKEKAHITNLPPPLAVPTEHVAPPAPPTKLRKKRPHRFASTAQRMKYTSETDFTPSSDSDYRAVG